MTRRNNINWLRILVITFTIGLLIWVFLANDKESQTNSLNNLVLQGKLISPPKALQEDLSEICKLAKVEKPVRINASYDSKFLNIYIIRSADSLQSLCGKGNSIYDPDNDLIILDVSLFDAEPLEEMLDLGITGVKENALYPFAWFAIAHELGHRQLHHSNSTFGFFSSTKGDKAEEAADKYSIQLLKRLMELPQYSNEWDLFDLPNDGKKQPQVYNLLIAAALSRMLYASYIDIGTTTGYSDQYHPPIAHRFSSLLKAAAEDTSVPTAYHQLLVYFGDVMKKMDSTMSRIKAEIQIDSLFNSTSLIDDTVFAQTNTGTFKKIMRKNGVLQDINRPELMIGERLQNPQNNTPSIYSLLPSGITRSYEYRYEFSTSDTLPVLRIGETNFSMAFSDILMFGRKALGRDDVSFFFEKRCANGYNVFFRSAGSDTVAICPISPSDISLNSEKLWKVYLPIATKVSTRQITTAEDDNAANKSLYVVKLSETGFEIWKGGPKNYPAILLSMKYALFSEKVSSDFMSGIIVDQENRLSGADQNILFVSDIVYLIKLENKKPKVLPFYLPLTKLFSAETNCNGDVLVFPKRGGRRLLFFPAERTSNL